jgi:hypothetical protein
MCSVKHSGWRADYLTAVLICNQIILKEDHLRFEIHTAMKTSITLFWVVKLCGLKMEVICFTEMLVATYTITYCHNPEDHNRQG